MAKKYLDYDGLLYFWQKIKTTFALLASPAFTGTPTAPTATTGTSTTQIATTEFVANTVGAMTSGVSDVKVDNASVVTSGIANIPTASTNQFGLVKVGTSPGMLVITTGSKSYNAAYIESQSSTISCNILPDATQSLKGAMSAADKTKLDSITMTNGIIDSSVLPSFVDDVIEAYARSNQTELGSTWLATGSASGTVITPETGKIYVLMNDSTSYSANSQFRWGGTAYVKLNDGGVTEITNAEIDTIVAS